MVKQKFILFLIIISTSLLISGCSDESIRLSNQDIVNKAINSNDINICKEIKNIDNCKGILHYGGGMGSQQDYEACKRKMNETEKCYFEFAKIANNSEVCNNLRNMACGNACYQSNPHDTCYIYFAKELNKIELCELIESTDSQIKCIKQFEDIKNITLCNTLTSIYAKKECLMLVAINTHNISVCDLIIEGEYSNYIDKCKLNYESSK